MSAYQTTFELLASGHLSNPQHLAFWYSLENYVMHKIMKAFDSNVKIWREMWSRGRAPVNRHTFFK